MFLHEGDLWLGHEDEPGLYFLEVLVAEDFVSSDPCEDELAFDPPLADATVECLDDLPTECDATQGATRGDVSCVLASAVSSRTECVGTAAMGTGADGAIVLFDIDGDPDDDRYFMPTDEGMTLIQYDNGVAVVTGQVADVDDENAILNVNIVYENGVSGAAWTGGYKVAQSCTATSDITDSWMIYILNSGVSFLTGEGSLDGTVLQLSHAPSSEFFGFQVGEMANDRNCNEGAGGWFSYEGLLNGVEIQGAQGDVLLDLACSTSQSTPCAEDAASASSVTLYYAAFDEDCGDVIFGEATTTRLDTEAPTFDNPPADVTVSCEDGLPEVPTDLRASDNCEDSDSEAPTVTMTGEVEVSRTCTGSYVVDRTFIAEDCSGNQASHTQTITVEDNEGPEITGGIPYTAECDGEGNQTELNDWLNDNGGATATDNCGTVTWSHDYTSLSDECGATGSASVTFTATDDCGNSSDITLTFTIEDTTAPTLTADNVHEMACEDYDPTAIYAASASDMCGDAEVVLVSSSEVSGVCARTYIHTYKAIDDCENESAEFQQTVNLIDNDAPVITGGDNETVECDGSGNTDDLNTWLDSNAGASATDNCDSDITWTNDFDALSDDCGETGSVTVTFTASDGCQNSSDVTFTFTIQDTTDPSITTEADDETVECDGAGNTDDLNAWLNSQGGAAASDICSGVTWSNDFDGLSDDCGETGTATVIFTATDECGNSTTTTATFTIEDTTNPSVDIDASNETVECDGAGNTDALNAWLNSQGGAAASDVCSGVTWSNDFDGLSDECGATGSATVIFTATDACGNSNTTSATFTIEDTTAPTWDAYDTYAYAACEDLLDPTDPTLVPISASDDCGNVTYSIDAYELSGGCPGTWMRVWTATDECYNVSETTEQYVQLYDNIKPVPVITCPADYTVNADENCDADTTPAAAGTATATATDNCAAEEDITVVITSSDGAITETCDGAYFFTRTWTATATDECDNTDETSCDQLITVLDNTAPIISGGADLTVECDGAGNGDDFAGWLASNGGATATDNCSAITWTYAPNPAELSDLCAATGAVTVIFTATDDCGNSSSTSALTFTIEDTTAPTIAGDAMTSLACDDWSCDADALEALGLFTVTEDCGDYTLAVTCMEFSGSCVTPVPGYYVTITATDECGNESLEFNQIIDLYDDVDPVPSIICPADYTITADADCNADTSTEAAGMATASATDNCDSNPEVDVTYTDGPSTYTCSGSYSFTRTFTATAEDHCGNEASTSCDQLITVNDETAPDAPVISGPADAEVFLGADCTTDASTAVTGEASATAHDNCDADPSIEITHTDGAPNYTCAGDDGQLDGSYTFVRTFTATATDDCGNEGASSTYDQTITVTDNTAPDFAGSSNEYSIACDEYDADTMYEVMAADNCDDDAAITILSNNEVSGSCAGSILRTYQAVDDCGNISTFQQTINLLDEVDPEVTITCPADQALTADGDCSADTSVEAMGTATFTATDNCDDALTTELSHSDEIAEGCNAGTYTITRTWTITAEDHCDNMSSASCTQTITVTDATAPVISGGANETVECDGAGNEDELNAWLDANGGATATDNCDDVTWSHNFTALSDLCGATGSADVTFTAQDCNGNSDSITLTFTIEDTTPPSASADAEVSVPCDEYSDAAEYGNFMASDACGGVTVTISDLAASGACAGSYMRTYTITDDCNNETTVSQIINLTDDEAPTFSISCPADVALNSDVDCTADTSEETHGTATFSDVMDNCDNDVQMAVSSADVITESCDGSYTIARTFTITGTDHCDNVTTKTCTQTITVTDIMAPSIDTEAANLTVECDGAGNAADLSGWLASNGGAAASDNCSAVTWSHSDATLSDLCGATGAVTVTFTATDDCGNQSSTSATFTIEDTTAPSLSIEGPANQDLEQNESCDVDTSVEELGNVTATASDDCGNATIEITHADGAATYTCSGDDDALEGSYTFVRTFTVTATDACGLSTTDTYDQTITVSDNLAPQFTNTCGLANGDAVDVCCEDLSGTVTIPDACDTEAADNCDSDVAIAYTETYVGEYAPTGDVMSYCLSTTPAAFADGEACNGLDPHAFSLFNFDGEPRVDFTSLGAGTVAQMNDGTWVLTQELTNEAGTGTLSLSVTYGAASSWDDWYVPGQTNYKRDCGVLVDDHENWDYRILQSGTLTGAGDYATLSLSLAHAPANEYYAMQVGLGANNQNDNYGYSGWIMASGTYNGDAVFFSGDLFGDLDCCLPWSIDREYTATDDCGNATDFAYVIDVNGDDCGGGDGALVSGGQAGDHTPVILGGAGDMTTGKSPIRVTNLQPNPTNDLSMLGFTVNENMRLRVDMFTMDGILVTELFDGIASPNVNHTLDIEADALQSGMYQIRLSSNQYLVVKKLLVTE